jgi:hypothetical protein
MNLSQVIIIVVALLLFNFLWNHTVRTKQPNIILPGSISLEESDNQNTKANKPLDPAIRYFFTIIALFPIVMGLWAINYWLSNYNLAVESENWTHVKGKILSKNVVGQTPSGSSGTTTAGMTYSPSVKYEFTYKNKRHEWHKIDFRNHPSREKEYAQEVLDSLPDVGEPVTVYISPEHKTAVLISGATNSNYFAVLVGTFFLLIGFIWVKLLYGF